MRLFGLGPMELGIILAIILVLFGPKQIPKLAKMFGKAAKDLREGFEGGEDEAAPAAKQAIPEATVPGQAAAEAEKKAEETSAS